ncbi:MAG: radical SAM protein, partial [Nanoarchaeota archaeon]
KKKIKIDENSVKFGLFQEDIEKEVREFNPDIVGVSCSFSMYESDSFWVIDVIKKINKNIKIVVGGAHASSNPKFVLRNRNIDLVVIGEGELTILEIAQRIRSGKRIDNILGTSLFKGKKFIMNKPREHISDMDGLDLAWHLIDFKKYFEHPDNSSVTITKPSINIISSRGCPGNCVFCSVHTVWGRKWRAMSIKKVVDQIEFLYKNYNIKHFRINDDNLTLNKERIIGICAEILKRNIDIKWDTPSGVALWTLDEEVLDIMKKSGYYRITFGIESGSRETLKYIGKNIDLEKTKKLIQHCHKIGLWVASFFIIGFPYETIKDIKETEAYIINSKLNFPFIFIAQPYQGTRMYHDFLKEGLIESFLNISNSTITKYNTKHFTANQLNTFRRNIYKNFYISKIKDYSNPLVFYKEFLSKIKNFRDIIYIIKIFRSMVTNLIY